MIGTQDCEHTPHLGMQLLRCGSLDVHRLVQQPPYRLQRGDGLFSRTTTPRQALYGVVQGAAGQRVVHTENLSVNHRQVRTGSRHQQVKYVSKSTSL